MSSLPRAYLRIDPNMDAHPDPGTLVLILCFANRQPKRGRFKTLDVLRKVVGKKKLEAAIERKDLVEKDGAFVVVGWQEWQEGDLTVGERMQRVRNRRSKEPEDLQESDRNEAVTQPSPNRIHASKAIDVDVDVDVDECVTTPKPPPPLPVEPRRSDAGWPELFAGLDHVKGFPEFQSLDHQAILNLPRFSARSGPIRLNGKPTTGLLLHVAGLLMATGRPEPRKVTVPAFDQGRDHAVTEADLAWDPRLGPRPEPPKGPDLPSQSVTEAPGSCPVVAA